MICVNKRANTIIENQQEKKKPAKTIVFLDFLATILSVPTLAFPAVPRAPSKFHHLLTEPEQRSLTPRVKMCW